MVGFTLGLKLESLRINNLDGEEFVLLPIIEQDAYVSEEEKGLELSVNAYHEGLVSLLLEETTDHLYCLFSITKLYLRVLLLEEPLDAHLEEHGHELKHGLIDLAELGGLLALLGSRAGA